MKEKNVKELKQVIELYKKTTKNTDMSAEKALELVLFKIKEIEFYEELENDDKLIFKGFLGC